MKNIRLFILCITSNIMACTSNIQRTNLSQIKFDELNIEIGKLKIKDSINVKYSFQNIGKIKLIINNVIPSCDCTLVSGWTKDSIEINEKGIIEILYYYNGIAKFNESINVYYNGERSPTLLTFSGEFIVK